MRKEKVKNQRGVRHMRSDGVCLSSGVLEGQRDETKWGKSP